MKKYKEHPEKLLEFQKTHKLFESPIEELTEKYITGRFG